jgi:hypothetical protein
LAKMFAGPDFNHSAIVNDLNKTKVVVLNEGACFDPYGGATDASESEGADGPVICFSVPRLMKVSILNLPDQIVALTFHEFAHHYGYGETDAVLIQKFIFDQLSSICTIEATIKDDPNSPKVSRMLKFQARHKFDLNRAVEITYEAKYRYNGGIVRLASIDPGFWMSTVNNESTRVDFSYLDLDGSVRKGLLTWEHTHDSGDGDYQSVETPVLSATIDGSALEATGVSISKECLQ